jgi:hypothetical protein
MPNGSSGNSQPRDGSAYKRNTGISFEGHLRV